MVKPLSTSKPSKRLIIRWTALEGLTAILLFLVLTALIEYIIVIYAISLGVKDLAILRWTGQLPPTNQTFTIVISPLFHLVPIAVMVTLACVWTYLTKHLAIKTYDERRRKYGTTSKQAKKAKKFFDKIKSPLLSVKSIAYFWQKIHSTQATLKGALSVILIFLVFVLLFSLFTYPKLIHETIANAYKTNPSLLNFIKGTTKAFTSFGDFFSAINNALLATAPSFRNFALGFGAIIKPLSTLDNASKYLVFQNAAVWIVALSALLYGEVIQKSYRYKRRR
jgi:hypothetical protein